MTGRAFDAFAKRAILSLRRRGRLARGLAWRAHPGFEVGRGVQLGKWLRLHVEPGGIIVLGDGCVVDDGVTLSVGRGARITLGPDSFLGHHTTIAARQRVDIGRGTFLAELVSVRDHDHDLDEPPISGASRVDAVRIGVDCWVAAKATVTRGVEIGDRTVVGANAVVTSSLPSDVVAVGVPARVLSRGQD